jgi:plastocyanin
MKRVSLWSIVGWLPLVAATGQQVAKAATTYHANVGAEVPDQSVEALGFFPNELWILEGDSIQWTFVTKDLIHTVTFLTQPPGGPEQMRPSAPPPPAGPPFAVQGVNCADPPPSSYNGSACVSTEGLTAPSTFKVTFPTAGNFKLVCLVHLYMNGTVHVLSNNATNAALLHTQQFYDEQGQQEANAIILDDNLLQFFSQPISSSPNPVTAGVGKLVATPGGLQPGVILRYQSSTIVIHQGESVTWANSDPTEPHTVTFGTEPANFNFTTQAGLGASGDDGTLTATIKCSPEAGKPCDADFGPESNPSQVYNPAIFLSSGFLQAQSPDRDGDTQLPPGTTRITITFPKPGNYYYHCALHDVDGMLGEVIVLP